MIKFLVTNISVYHASKKQTMKIYFTVNLTMLTWYRKYILLSFPINLTKLRKVLLRTNLLIYTHRLVRASSILMQNKPQGRRENIYYCPLISSNKIAHWSFLVTCTNNKKIYIKICAFVMMSIYIIMQAKSKCFIATPSAFHFRTL